MFTLGIRSIYAKNINSAIKEGERNGFGTVEIHLSSPRLSLSEKKYPSSKTIIQVHAPMELSLIFTQENLRISAKKELKKIIESCRKIGARCLTLHIGRAPTYHDVNNKKLISDDIYPDLYSNLLEGSLKYITSIAPKNLFICIENTDNFVRYQNIIQKYLKTGKLFLTWDIRKSYSYDSGKLIKSQWDFLKKNKKYVKNLHISGLKGSHGEIKKWDKRFDRFIELFKEEDLPLIIEILPLKSALIAQKVIVKKLNMQLK